MSWADFQARAHWEDDVWGEVPGRASGLLHRLLCRGHNAGPTGQPMSGVFMEPKYGCCAYGEVEFEQQVVNNWDEVKESELACGRPCCSMRWLDMVAGWYGRPLRVGDYPSTRLTDGEVCPQQPLLFGVYVLLPHQSCPMILHQSQGSLHRCAWRSQQETKAWSQQSLLHHGASRSGSLKTLWEFVPGFFLLYEDADIW